jgi:dinuclear metal center YbgI/SA1388 family protein
MSGRSHPERDTHDRYFMTVREIQHIIEQWAPREIAWDRDNVGLQVGSPGTQVKAITVCLDITAPIIQEAEALGVNLIISHHPLLFRPLRSVNVDGGAGYHIRRLMEAKISLLSAHTNLDFTRGGTSFALAERLELLHVDFLVRNHRLKRKIVTFVPEHHVERVAEAMAKAGAGRIGNYDECSFRSSGRGTFKGNADSHPAVGKRGELEHVEEVRLEMQVDQPFLHEVLQALVQSHPYEEVAYDVYPLENVSPEYGMGIIGELKQPMSAQNFVAHVKKRLRTKALRCTQGTGARIHRVAACGGSGAELLEEAVRQQADAYVTADVKYHDFHDASGRVLLVDAGHYETEHPVVDAVVARLKHELKKTRVSIPVISARRSTNPIVYN